MFHILLNEHSSILVIALKPSNTQEYIVRPNIVRESYRSGQTLETVVYFKELEQMVPEMAAFQISLLIWRFWHRSIKLEGWKGAERAACQV